MELVVAHGAPRAGIGAFALGLTAALLAAVTPGVTVTPPCRGQSIAVITVNQHHQQFNMATQGTSNIAGTQAGTGVPIGKTGTTGTTGLAGTQPSQIGVQGGLAGTQAGTMGTQTGLETGQTTYGGPTQQLGGTYGTGQNVAGQQYGQGQYGQGQYGGYGQERESRGLFGDIENWFRDPFNVGFGGLFHRRRRGGRDYPEDTQYGQGGYGQGTYGQQQLGYGQPYGQGTYQGSQEYGMTPYNQYGRGGQGGLFFPEMSLLEGGGFGGLDLMNRELSSLGSFTPSMRMDIQENAAEYICKVDMPGVSFGDVNVECDDRTRTIHVNVRKNLREEKDEDVMGTRVHRIERASGTGYRAIRMPPNVDLNNIKADLREGVLFINVPKTGEAQAFGRKRIPLGGTNAMMGTGTNLTGSNISSTTMGGNISGGGVRQGLATGTTGTNVGNVTGTSYSQGTSGYGQSGNIASGNVGSTGTTGMSGSNVSGARQL